MKRASIIKFLLGFVIAQIALQGWGVMVSEESRPTPQLDNTKMALQSVRYGSREIYVMNADGTNPRRLTHNSESDGNPSWSPDGAKIAFHSKRDGNGEIYVMNADGTNPRRLTNNSVSDDSPSWSPFLK